MDALLLAIRSILSWAWDIFSINIPVLNVPFWIIAMAAVAVDLAFYILGRLIGSSVASASSPSRWWVSLWACCPVCSVSACKE